MKKYLHSSTPLGHPFMAQFLFLLMLFSSVGVWGQVNLPHTRTTWNSTPIGWTDTPKDSYTTTFACSGSNGAKFGTTGDLKIVFLDSAPDQLSFVVKSNMATTSALLVEESDTGSTYTTVISLSGAIDLPTTCTTKGTYTLKSSTRYIRWTFTKGSQNLTMDDVSITKVSTTTSITSGNWFDASTWSAGVPTSGDNAIIANGHVVTMNTTTGGINTRNSGTTTTVNTGGTLATNQNYINNGTTTVNGSFQLDGGGWVSDAGGTNALVYGTAGTLIFNTAYTANNGNYWPSSNGPVNVTVNSSSPLDLGFARTVTGLFQTSSNINNPGNITIGTNGTLRLNSGYDWSGTGSPTYGNASLLKYNSGGTPGRSVEWNQTNGTIGTTAGYPNNVQVSNNTTLNFANGGTSTYKADKTVVIDAGSSLYQNYGGGNAGLAVGTDLTVNGNLTLGTTTGDLNVGGNFTVASTGFNSYGRAVIFNGTGTQTIARTTPGTIDFDYITINKTASSVVLSATPATNITLNATSGDFLRLTNIGSLDLNGRTMSLNNIGGGIYVDGARTITSSVAGGKIEVNQYKRVSNNSGTGALTLAANVTVNLNANGNFDFGKSSGVTITTLNGTLSINSTTSCYVNTNPPIYGVGSLLKYNSTGTYGRGVEWSTTSGAGFPSDVQVSNNTTLDVPNTGGAFSTNLALSRDLTVDSGSSLYMDYGAGPASGALTVGRNVNISGNLSLGDTAPGDLFVAGTWIRTGVFTANGRLVTFNGAAAQTVTGATTFDYLTLNNTNGLTLQPSSAVIVNQNLGLTNGKLTLGANNLTIGSTGTITGASTSSYVVTNGAGQLKRNVAASAISFPVGNTTYNPIIFNNTGGSSDVYGVRVTDGVLTTALDISKTVKRRWLVSEAFSGGSNLKAVAQYNTGEPDTNFNTGTTPKIGFYDGSTWTDVDATKAGSDPYTLSSITNSTPATLTGTQYFALGTDNAFTTKATKYVITAITPSSPGAGYPFSVTVQAQDAFGFAANVSANSTFSLTTNGNAGAIGGTVSGTILSGTNSIIVTGVTLATAGIGVTVTATNSGGLSINTGTSATFIVLAKATQLAFVAVPATGSVGVNLPSFTVEARRPDNSIDTNYTGNITIAKFTGTGTLSGTLAPAAIAGVATFSDAQFDAADTYTITATATVLTSATSGNIVVTVSSFTVGDYRTNPNFTGSVYFDSTTPSGSIYPWQRWNGSNWVDVTGSSATSSPQNLSYVPANIYLNASYVNLANGKTYNNIIVESGSVYSGNTTTGLTIDTNRTLDIKAGSMLVDGRFIFSAGSKLIVRNDAFLTIRSSSFNFTRNATSNFTIEGEGFVEVDNYLANLWTGTENFSSDSYFAVYGWDRSQRLFDNITDINDNSSGAKFGYLDIDVTISSNWTFVLPSSGTYKLTSKDLYLTNNNSVTDKYTLNTENATIGGNLVIDGSANISAQSQSGTKTLNVKGNFIKNGSGQYTNTNSGTSYVSTLNVDGDFMVNAGTFSLDIGATGASTSIVNLKGNLSKDSGSYMVNSNTNSTTNAFNFNGTTTQLVDLNVRSADDMLRYNFYINNGAYVKLLTRNWAFGTSSKLTVENGGILDFGYDVSNNPLALVIVPSQNSQSFDAQAGSILKINSPNGISAGGVYTGNVQIGAGSGSRKFGVGATYHYLGKNNQVSGNGLPNAITGKVIVELETDELKFNASGNKTFAAAGILEIRKGIVQDNSADSFNTNASQLGNLTMSGGRYKIDKTTVQPPFDGIYDLSAGVVEFGNNAETGESIRSKSYQNIEVTGSNVNNSDGVISLKDDGTFKVSGKFISSNGDNYIQGTNPSSQTLTVQTGGNFTTAVIPGLYGSSILSPYQSIQNSIENIILEPGSFIEYARLTNALPFGAPNGNQTVSAINYQNLIIAGSSIKTASGNMVINGTTTVKAGATFDVPTPLVITALDKITVENDGNFIFNNDTNLMQSTATISNESLQNTGNITVKRESPMKKNNYTYWSSPVSGQNLYGFSQGTSTTRFYYYRESDDKFYNDGFDGNTVFNPTQGYAIMSPSIYTGLQTFTGRFVGVPNNGTKNADNTTLKFQLKISSDRPEDDKGYNLIGNPYPSNIDFDKLFTINDGLNVPESTAGKIFQLAYFWTNVNPNRQGSTNGTGSTYSGNAYAIYNGVGGIPATSETGSPIGIPPTNIIKVGQGFIIKARPGQNDKALIFNNTIRTTEHTHFFSKGCASEKDRYWLKLTTPASDVNTILIGYVPGATNNFEWDYDAPLLSVGSDSFYTALGAEKLGIQGRTYPLNTQDVVKLGTKHFEVGNYTISLGDREGIFAGSQSIYLKDNQNSKVTNLSEGNYTFTVNAGVTDGRFEIIYKPEVILSTGNTVKDQLVIYRDANDFVVKSYSSKITELELYDLAGRLILKVNPNRKEVRIDDKNFINGVYILNLTRDGKVISRKITK